MLPCRVLPTRARPVAAVRRSSFLRVPALAATSTGGVLQARASQARTVPSATFRTSSTVCSATGLAGLFRPAATSESRSPGGSPPTQPYRLVDGPYPHGLGYGTLHDGCPPCATHLRQPSGLALHRDPLRRPQGLAVSTARSPPELFLLQVLLLLAVGAPSRTLRSGPWPQDRQVVPAVDLQRITDEKPGFPLSRTPTCSRFPA